MAEIAHSLELDSEEALRQSEAKRREKKKEGIRGPSPRFNTGAVAYIDELSTLQNPLRQLERHTSRSNPTEQKKPNNLGIGGFAPLITARLKPHLLQQTREAASERFRSGGYKAALQLVRDVFHRVNMIPHRERYRDQIQDLKASIRSIIEDYEEAPVEKRENNIDLSTTAVTPTLWRHLARAATILHNQEMNSKSDFRNTAHRLQDEIGPKLKPGGKPVSEPGRAIWTGVQRLGKTLLKVEHLPERYLRFEGWSRLVFDILNDELSGS